MHEGVNALEITVPYALNVFILCLKVMLYNKLNCEKNMTILSWGLKKQR